MFVLVPFQPGQKIEFRHHGNRKQLLYPTHKQSSLHTMAYVAVLGRTKQYSVAYFDRIIVFEALKHRTSVKGRAHMCSVDS